MVVLRGPELVEFLHTKPAHKDKSKTALIRDAEGFQEFKLQTSRFFNDKDNQNVRGIVYVRGKTEDLQPGLMGNLMKRDKKASSSPEKKNDEPEDDHHDHAHAAAYRKRRYLLMKNRQLRAEQKDPKVAGMTGYPPLLTTLYHTLLLSLHCRLSSIITFPLFKFHPILIVLTGQALAVLGNAGAAVGAALAGAASMMTAFSPFGRGKKDDKGDPTATPPPGSSPKGEKKVLGGLGVVASGGLFGRKQGGDTEHLKEEASLVVRTVNQGLLPYQKIVLGLGQRVTASSPGLLLSANQTSKASRGKKRADEMTEDGELPLNWRYSHEDKRLDQTHGLGPNASMTGLGPGPHNKPHTYSAVLFLSASSLFVSKQSTVLFALDSHTELLSASDARRGGTGLKLKMLRLKVIHLTSP